MIGCGLTKGSEEVATEAGAESRERNPPLRGGVQQPPDTGQRFRSPRTRDRRSPDTGHGLTETIQDASGCYRVRAVSPEFEQIRSRRAFLVPLSVAVAAAISACGGGAKTETTVTAPSAQEVERDVRQEAKVRAREARERRAAKERAEEREERALEREIEAEEIAEEEAEGALEAAPSEASPPSTHYSHGSHSSHNSHSSHVSSYGGEYGGGHVSHSSHSSHSSHYSSS